MRLIYVALAWTFGLVVAHSASVSASAWLVLAVQVTAVAFIVRRSRTYGFIAFVAAMGALGALRMAVYPSGSPLAVYNNSGGLTIEGVVSAAPDARDTVVQLQVAADTLIRAGATTRTSGGVLVEAPPVAGVRYGDRIRATGLLIAPGEFDSFSYADFLARSEIYSIMRYASVEVLSRGHGGTFNAALIDLRTAAAGSIARGLPEPQAGLLTGILLGNERGIAPQIADAFSATGAAHVIAISGFNMALIAGVVMTTLNRVTRRRGVAALLGIGILAVYTLLVGANAAVIRAAIMSSLLVIGEVLRRRTFVPTSLALVALILTVQNPTILWDVSFQLSFFATLGLALFAKPLSRRFDTILFRLFRAPLARSTSALLSEPLIVSIAALILTLPLTVYYFHRLPLLVLPVNLLVVPVQAYILYLGGTAALVGLVAPGVAQMLYWACMLLLTWTIEIVQAFAPLANIAVYADGRLIALGLLVIIGAAFMQATRPPWWEQFSQLVRGRAASSAAIVSSGALVLLLVSLWQARPDGMLHVWMLDAGHSNAVLLQTPGGAQVLVDGGRYPSRLLTAIGERLPFNDREIELLVLTQPDVFEFGALPTLLDRYSIGAALTHNQPNLSPEYADLQARLSAVRVVTVTAGYTVEISDGTRLEALHPPQQPSLGDPLDAVALVLRVTYGDVSYLLAGDLGAEGQRSLLENGHWPVASILQMPQHGTQRALDDGFLQAVQPRVILLQSDAANTRGDPDPDVMTQVEGIPVFRTDRGGTLHTWTDGTALWVQAER